MGYGDVRLSGLLAIAAGLARRSRRCCWGSTPASCSAAVGGMLLTVLRVVPPQGTTRSGRSCCPRGPGSASSATAPLGAAYGCGDPGLVDLVCADGHRAGPARHRRERLAGMLRWLTAGESHGPGLVAVLEGLPAHVQVTSADIVDALARRRLGYGRGARMKFEQDQVDIIGGLRHGESLGSPVAIRIGNTEWPKWEKVMSADPVDEVELEALARNAAAHPPAARARRPGRHAEVRLRRGPAGPRAGLRPRDRRPGRARRGRPAVPASRPSAPTSSPTSSRSAPSGRRPARCPLPRDVAALDADPVRCLDAGRQQGDGQAEIDQAHKRRRHPRRGRRGRGPRAAARARLPRALGPAARRPARRRADGHPGDQGRRGRRRLRARGRPPAPAPTTRSSRTDDGHPAYLRALRRHRGRHVDRRGAAGARRDEADRDRAAGAAHRRRGHRRGRPSPTTSAPTCARCRRPASSPRRWWRWCSPTWCWRSSAATRWRRPGATSRATSSSLRFVTPEPTAPRVVLVGPMGAGKTTVGRLLAEPVGRRASATPTTTSRRPRASAISEIFVDEGEDAVPGAGARRRGRGAGRRTRACSRSAAARCSTPATRADLRGHRVVFLRRRARRRGQAGRPRRRPAAAARQRPRRGSRRCSTSGAPVYAEVATVTSSTPTAARPRRSPTRWRAPSQDAGAGADARGAS